MASFVAQPRPRYTNVMPSPQQFIPQYSCVGTVTWLYSPGTFLTHQNDNLARVEIEFKSGRKAPSDALSIDCTLPSAPMTWQLLIFALQSKCDVEVWWTEVDGSHTGDFTKHEEKMHLALNMLYVPRSDYDHMGTAPPDRQLARKRKSRGTTRK